MLLKLLILFLRSETPRKDTYIFEFQNLFFTRKLKVSKLADSRKSTDRGQFCENSEEKTIKNQIIIITKGC